MVVIKKPNYKNSSIDNIKQPVNFTAVFSALVMVLFLSGIIPVMTLFLVAPASALDTSGMDVRYSDSFDNASKWSNPQGSWYIGPSIGWGTGNVAYTGSNHVANKNRPQNLITNLGPEEQINLSEYRTVILQFDTSVEATKRGSQAENVIVTDSNGVPHIVWAKSKATFEGLQQVDISSIAAGNKSINLTFQYMKKGKPVSGSQWQVDDVEVLASKTGEKPYSTVQFNQSVYTVLEGDGAYAVLNLTCTPACLNQVKVNWTAMDGTALAGTNYGTEGDYFDYNVNGTVTFESGEYYKLIQVPILNDNHYSVPDLSFNVTIEDITDAYGNTITGTPAISEVIINDANAAQAVKVTVPETAEVDEGSAWTGSGSFTDAALAAPYTATVDYGDGSDVETLALNADKTFSLSHTYADDDVYTVEVKVTNNGGAFGFGYTTVTVDNVAPTLTLSGASSVDEDAMYTLTLSSSDPGADIITSWDIDWDDGNIETVSGNPTSATHVYASPNDYTISATATDEDGTWAAGNTVDVHVNVVIVAYTIPLSTGWNLISFPVVNTTLKASELEGTGIQTVSSYNMITGDYDSYIIGISPSSNDITMKTDVGYFVYCTMDTSIVVYGPKPEDRSVTIFPGWNLIGWSSFTSSTAKAVCAEPSLSGMQTISKYNAATGDYDSYIEDVSPDSYDFTMHDGIGYFIYTPSETSQTLYYEVI